MHSKNIEVLQGYSWKILGVVGASWGTEPEQISAIHVRAFLASYAERGCKDSYIHTYARSIRTFTRFLYNEEYIPKPVTIQMPKIGEMRLPVLSIDEVKKVLNACHHQRHKAIILLMVDTGLRLVKELMSKRVVTVTEDAPLMACADLLIQEKMQRLPVMNKDNRVVGIVHIRDIFDVVSRIFLNQEECKL